VPRAHRDSSLTLARPLAPGEHVDLDRATALEIARLPRVGLTLARAIVRNRDANGPFGSLEALDRVPGIGPGLLAALAEQVTFSAAGRLDGSATRPVAGILNNGDPGTGHAPTAEPPPRPAAEPLNLNSATAADLERLPFIGPFMARQIVAYRDRHGPFPSVDSLVKVPGVGPATLAKIRDRILAQ
jgi:competence ComEA-like helix-hairpin-helix protein